MNSWKKSLEVGTKGEEEVVAYINQIRPKW